MQQYRHDPDVWEELVNAVILQAVKDYRSAKARLRKQPHDESALLLLQETRLFFRSKWFSTLSDANGNLILDRLEKE